METVYVATSLSNIENARTLVKALEDCGMRITYKWQDLGAVTMDRYREISVPELNGVIEARTFIGLLPGKKGTQTEIGAALAAKQIWEALGNGVGDPSLTRRVFLYAAEETAFNEGVVGSDNYPSVFWHHPSVERIIGEDMVTAVINKLVDTRVLDANLRVAM